LGPKRMLQDARTIKFGRGRTICKAMILSELHHKTVTGFSSDSDEPTGSIRLTVRPSHIIVDNKELTANIDVVSLSLYRSARFVCSPRLIEPLDRT